MQKALLPVSKPYIIYEVYSNFIIYVSACGYAGTDAHT